MTYEGWSDIMYAVQDGWSPYSYLYFILIILAGPIFALQLFLVVISTKYHTVKIKQAADLTNKADKLECQRAAKTKAEKRARQALRAVGPPPPRASPQGTDEEMHGQRSNRVAPLAPLASASPPACPPDVAGEQCSNRGAAVSESQSPGQQRSNRVDELDQGKAALAAGGATAGQSASRLTRELSVSQKAQHLLEDLALSDTLLNLNMAMICLNMLVMAADANVNLCELDDPSPYAVFHKSSDLFYSRAEEKHSWPVNHSVTGFKAVTEGSNIFFAGVFLLDLLVKVAGLGPRKLFLGGVSSLWNVFDVLIVALSVSEVKSVYENTKCFSEAQTCFAAEQCGAASGFSLLRVFRLARLGKLLRKIPDVYHQLVALGKSVAAVGALLTLILLFMLIFVVLGMSVFGGVMTIEYDAHELMLGSHVYVEVPLDAWRDRRPVSMPGRRGIIVDVDAEMRPLTPWKVVVWNAEGLQQQLGLDQDSAVWASDGHALVSNSSMITAIVPRLNYDDFFSAIITTFQILTTEAWNDTMYDAVGSTGDVKAVIFFYAIIVVGNWILLNMFIAIIIERFAEQRKVAFNAAYLNMKQQFVERFAGMPRQRLKAELSRLFDEVDKNCSGFIDKVELQHLLIHNLHLDLGEAQFLRIYNKYDRDRSGEIDKSEFYFFVTELLEESMREVGSQKNAMSKAADGLQSETFTSSFRSSYSSGSSSIQGSRYRVAEGLHHEREDAQSSESMRLDNDANHQLQPNATAEANKNVLQTRSQVPPRSFCDGCREASSNRFKPRVFCSLLVSNKWFERVILFCIVYSSITLALDAPLLPDDHQLRFFLAASDYIMNFCFVVECIAKIIAQGPSVYLSCRWNRLDFLIVITAIADMILSAMLEGQGVNLAFLKAVRILRALRPLRLISRAKGLRLIIDGSQKHAIAAHSYLSVFLL
jgi:Ca2+-binding EF-hand superfamily protein